MKRRQFIAASGFGTLAARALAWAEDAFPVFDVPRVEDPRPLVRRPTGAPRSIGQ